MIRDIVVSGLLGFVRKSNKKKKENIPKYRSSKFSLRDWVNKKLTEKYNWFKTRKVESDEKDENCSDEKDENKVKWRPYQKRKEPIEALVKVDTKKDIPPQSVLFVQYTENGELAARIREVILKLKPWTGINFKVI